MNESTSYCTRTLCVSVVFYRPLLGGCYVYSSKINAVHIISGVKVFISGDYIKCEASTIVECGGAG